MPARTGLNKRNQDSLYKDAGPNGPLVGALRKPTLQQRESRKMTTAMIALLHRDMRVARRELKFFFLRVGLQPLLFTFIFGYVMPRLGIVQGAYANALL